MRTPRLLVPALLLASLLSCSPDARTPAADQSKPAEGAPAASDHTGHVPLPAAISWLPVEPERQAGYERSAVHLWTDADHDGCDTRAETLLAQAVTPPKVGPGCKLTGGSWVSYYDDATGTDPSKLDIDHVVPLSDGWASGAFAWTAARREAYANDLQGRRSLIAVTAHENRAKGDRDPAEWMPPAADAECQYLTDWVAVKLRWDLSADAAERTALDKIAGHCPDSTVSYTPAP